MTPVEALESAVAHHKDELPPTLWARHTTLTWLRRAATLVIGIGIAGGGIWLGDRVGGWFATLSVLFAWVFGFAMLSRAVRRTRHAIASSTMRAFESTQSLGALGAGGASVGVSALLTPAQKMLQQQARAEQEKADLKRARKEAKERARGVNADNEARDFDDA